MLTLDALRAYGADTADGLSRCMNMEEFYLRMVGKAMDDPYFEKLSAAIRGGDLTAGYEAAHSLKGSMGNLSLTPIEKPVTEMSDHLKHGDEMDYLPLLEEVEKQLAALRALRG